MGSVIGKQTSTSASTTASSTTAVGKVDFNPTAIKILLVESGDGGFSLGLAAEGDETEATRATGVTIAHHD